MGEGENWRERKNLPQTSRELAPASPPRHGAGMDSAKRMCWQQCRRGGGVPAAGGEWAV